METYLDHAATSPLDPRVFHAMRPWLEGGTGNASSVHAAGRHARATVEGAREQVAEAVGVAPLEVLFTGGGSESDNTAVKGIARAARDAGAGAHLVTTAIEHPAVLQACRWLASRDGFDLTVVGVDADGLVAPDDVFEAVRPDTVLVSVMAVNNELGTIQPLAEIGPRLAADQVPLHSDAVQALGRVPLDLPGWGVGAASFSAHKVGGPTGVGVLTVRRDLPCEALIHGGGQERDIRSGTLDVAGIVGCGVAFANAVAERDDQVARLGGLRDRLLDGLLAVEGVTLNGSTRARVSHNAHVAVRTCDTEALLLALDAQGVQVSAGSACQSGANEPSPVLEAIGADLDGVAHLRFTLGRTTTRAQIDHTVLAFAETVARLRLAGGGLGW